LNSPTFESAGEGVATVAIAGMAPMRPWLRPNQYPVPPKALVPLFVMALTAPPENPP
jgi:hypothetical protein